MMPHQNPPHDPSCRVTGCEACRNRLLQQRRVMANALLGDPNVQRKTKESQADMKHKAFPHKSLGGLIRGANGSRAIIELPSQHGQLWIPSGGSAQSNYSCVSKKLPCDLVEHEVTIKFRIVEPSNAPLSAPEASTAGVKEDNEKDNKKKDNKKKDNKKKGRNEDTIMEDSDKLQ